jgi:hypothetical protein
VKRGGVRRIPLSELSRAGLLENAEHELELEEAGGDAGEAARELVSRELLAELGAAHEELGRLRAIAEQSESTLAEELERERARRAELEQQANEYAIRAGELEHELGELRSRSFVSRILNR